jgi:tripartite-type tricarboxylate transporter receptor subunit TctC
MRLNTFDAKRIGKLTSAIGIASLIGPLGFAFAQTPFYQGKTITMIASRAPGGTGELRDKALLPFLRKYVPGNPTILMEYMDGGGGRKAANYMYGSARPDGLTIGALASGTVTLAILGESGVMYNIDRFIYLGASESSSHQIIYTRKELGLSNLEKLRAKPGLRIGGQTVGHVSYISGRLFAYFLDLKDPRFIVGYSSPEVDVALMRGELDARANLATSVLRRNPDWVEKNMMDFHAIMEIPHGVKHPRFSQLPEIESFARTETDKQVLATWRVFRLAGSPYLLPPGTPKDRVDIIQAAMRKALNDPEFHKEYTKIVGEEPNPLMPEELTAAIKGIPRNAEVAERIKKISGSGPLPPR